jgi:DNA polymerase epsilon subunit 4
VHHHDNLEFLEDLVPKTVKFKDVKAMAAATRASLRGERAGNQPEAGGEEDAAASQQPQQPQQPNGKKHKSHASRPSLNGNLDISSMLRGRPRSEDRPADPNDQLQMEMEQARGDGDVEMAD